MREYEQFAKRVEQSIEDAKRMREENDMGMYSQDELDSIYGDLFDDLREWEEHNDFHPSSESEWDRADAYQRGEENPEAAWVCTNLDVWHANPYYKGPRMPHPELEIWEDEDVEAWRRGEEAREARAKMSKDELKAFWDEVKDDDIPF